MVERDGVWEAFLSWLKKEELDTESDYGHFSSWSHGQQGGEAQDFL